MLSISAATAAAASAADTGMREGAAADEATAALGGALAPDDDQVNEELAGELEDLVALALTRTAAHPSLDASRVNRRLAALGKLAREALAARSPADELDPQRRFASEYLDVLLA